MECGVPRGIDDNTAEAIRRAAGEAGISVEAWLRRAIVERAAAIDRRPESADSDNDSTAYRALVAAVAGLTHRVADLGARDLGPTVRESDDINELVRRFDLRIAALRPGGPDELSSAITEINARQRILEGRNNPPAAGSAGVSEISDEMRGLRRAIEEAVQRIDDTVGGTGQRQSLTDIARDVAEVKRMLAASDPFPRSIGRSDADGEVRDALRRDLDLVRAAVAAGERQTETSLAALYTTITAVQQRLARLEERAASWMSSHTVLTGTNGPEPVIPRAPANPADRSRNLAALRELAASTSDPTRSAGDRRADFIAAARRAAQAAVAEATAGGGQKESRGSDDGAFARIGQAIRGRRMSFLLAAAALILALGAVKLLGPSVEPARGAAAESPDQPVIAAARAPIAKPGPVFVVTGEPSGLVAPANDARSAIALAGSATIETAPVIGRPLPQQVSAKDGDAGNSDGGPSERREQRSEAADATELYRQAMQHEQGRGVERDLVKALDLYQQAAKKGSAGAMYNLAVLISRGAGGRPDQVRALPWFLAAANRGVRDSQYNLGVIYSQGLGTKPDLAEAYKWFAIAAAQGDREAAGWRDRIGRQLPPEQRSATLAVVQAWRPEGAPATGSAEGLDPTDRRQLVSRIQALLTEMGYDPGPADGVDGPRTKEAIRAFQRSIGAVDTGVIDRQLVAAIARPSG